MIETIAKYVTEKDWEAIFTMGLCVYMDNSAGHRSLYFHSMEKSPISTEEINDINGAAYVVDSSSGNFAVIQVLIGTVCVSFIFNK